MYIDCLDIWVLFYTIIIVSVLAVQLAEWKQEKNL